MPLHIISNNIQRFILFFYKPFGKIMTEQLFCYACCGAFITTLDFCLYYVIYNYGLNAQNATYLSVTLSPHVAAQLLSFMLSFPVGFFLQKFVTFTNSTLKGRIQLFRYMVIVVACIVLNIVLIKLFVEYYGFNAVISKLLTIVFVVTFSYFAQRNYSFKEAK